MLSDLCAFLLFMAYGSAFLSNVLTPFVEIITRKKWFHFVQLALSVSELYGGFMTFGISSALRLHFHFSSRPRVGRWLAEPQHQHLEAQVALLVLLQLYDLSPSPC